MPFLSQNDYTRDLTLPHNRRVPSQLAAGAGAEMRRTLGTAVFSGMLGVTLFGIFLTPVFFYVIQAFTDWRTARTLPSPFGRGEPGTAISAQT